jgi:TPP-dependent pyruvate/acetoin dehydrogenase alpha subunit
VVQRTAQKPTTPGSKRTGAKPHSGLDRDALLKAYEKMSRIRAFEDRLHEENATGDIPGFIHLYSGQEAIAVGVCENLSDADYIGSTHRGHGHCIAKGCDLNGMMAEIFGKDDGLCRGKGGSMHIADLSVGLLGANAIVGGAPSLAIGAALSGKTLRNGVIAASFTGDGGSNQGTVFEAMNMAVVLDLPIVFVIDNNGFGEATGTDYAVGAPDIAARAASFGMPAVKVDGTDFFAVYDAMAEASERARTGGGPTTIEAAAFRWHGHFEGDAQLYRTAEQVAQLRETKDPLKNFRSSVDVKKVSTADLDAVDEQSRVLVDEAVAKARAAAYPPVENLLTDVYVSY